MTLSSELVMRLLPDLAVAERREVASHLARFQSWAEGLQIDPLAPTASDVATYVLQRSRLSLLCGEPKRVVACLDAVSRAAGHPGFADDPLLRARLVGFFAGASEKLAASSGDRQASRARAKTADAYPEPRSGDAASTRSRPFRITDEGRRLLAVVPPVSSSARQDAFALALWVSSDLSFSEMDGLFLSDVERRANLLVLQVEGRDAPVRLSGEAVSRFDLHRKERSVQAGRLLVVDRWAEKRGTGRAGDWIRVRLQRLAEAAGLDLEGARDEAAMRAG